VEVLYSKKRWRRHQGCRLHCLRMAANTEAWGDSGPSQSSAGLEHWEINTSLSVLIWSYSADDRLFTQLDSVSRQRQHRHHTKLQSPWLRFNTACSRFVNVDIWNSIARYLADSRHRVTKLNIHDPGRSSAAADFSIRSAQSWKTHL
jgi:hypothetical protein